MNKDKTNHREPEHSTSEQLENDARIALLNHYSSKSTNQTILLLTLAFIFVTFVQLALNMGVVKDYVLLAGFWAFAGLGVRQFGRLLYWGELGTAITRVKMSNDESMTTYQNSTPDEQRLEGKIKIDVRNGSIELPLVLESTFMARLALSCTLYFYARRQKQNSLAVKFFFFSGSWLWFKIAFALMVLSPVLRWCLVVTGVWP
jgi:hypothetical protein